MFGFLISIDAGAESIELHSGVPDDMSTIKEWQVVSDSVPNGLISMCLDRNHLSNDALIEKLSSSELEPLLNLPVSQ